MDEWREHVIDKSSFGLGELLHSLSVGLVFLEGLIADASRHPGDRLQAVQMLTELARVYGNILSLHEVQAELRQMQHFIGRQGHVEDR